MLVASAAVAQPVVAPPNPAAGKLFIVGGGRISDSLRQKFVDLAGGRRGRLIVIPTASESADRPNADGILDPWKRYGFQSLEILHTRLRDKANDPAFTGKIDFATGVWISGGDQSRVTAVFLGTAVEKKLHDLLKRGGVIGGTSAGAAVQTKVMITGGREKATVGTGFDFLPGSVVDQHFLVRKRQGRLMGLLKDQPALIGFGIDEGTALIVRASKIEVAGASVVTVCFAAGNGEAAESQTLKPGDIADLTELQKTARRRDPEPASISRLPQSPKRS